jgi:nucleoside-diphosphate-sugar epimerase
MKILLTGCAGFIGSHTLDRLLADGHQVISVDNFDPFYDRALKAANIEQHADNPSFELLEADLADENTYTKLKFLLGNQPGDVPQTWADVTKAKKLFGYEPETNFSEGIQGFVAWRNDRSTF